MNYFNYFNLIVGILIISNLIILGIIIKTKDYSLFGAMFGISFVIVAVSGMIYLAVNIDPNNKHKSYEYKDVEISTLKDDKTQSISGSFFLGIGSVSSGSITSYSFYVDYPQGSKLMTIDIHNYSDVYINETDSITPRIKNYFIRTIKHKHDDFWTSRDSTEVGEWRENKNSDKIIYVPTNTIYKNFTLNK